MRLVVNVHVPGHGWFGPAHDNADQVPEAIAALITNPDAWAVAPASGDATADASEGSAGDPQVGAGDDAPATPPAVVVSDTQAVRLAALPDDKTILLGFADELALDVDRRKGAVKLRAEIQAALDKRIAAEIASGQTGASS